jgi:hypothetical protein
MEKKVRVKRLNHQDDAKRSWAATYPLIEDFKDLLPEDWERAQAELNTAENDYPQISSSDGEYNADNAAK